MEEKQEKIFVGKNDIAINQAKANLKLALKDLELLRKNSLAFVKQKDLPEQWNEILSVIDSSLTAAFPQGLPVKIADAIGKQPEYLAVYETAKRLSKNIIFLKYQKFFKFSRGKYKIEEAVYQLIEEDNSTFITDDIEIDVYNDLKAVIDVYRNVLSKYEGDMLRPLTRFANSSYAFTIDGSFKISPDISFVRKVAERLKKEI